MTISKKSEYTEPTDLEICKFCKGKGIIEVFRDDLEEYEQIDCKCQDK